MTATWQVCFTAWKQHSTHPYLFAFLSMVSYLIARLSLYKHKLIMVSLINKDALLCLNQNCVISLWISPSES